MKEFFIDISKICAKALASDDLLDSVVESTKVPMRLGPMMLCRCCRRRRGNFMFTPVLHAPISLSHAVGLEVKIPVSM